MATAQNLLGSDAMLRFEQLDPRDCPAVYAAAGSLVYEVSTAGQVADPFTAFPDASAVPVRVAADHGVIYVGAGEGGGPRLSAFDTGWARGTPARDPPSQAPAASATLPATPNHHRPE